MLCIVEHQLLIPFIFTAYKAVEYGMAVVGGFIGTSLSLHIRQYNHGGFKYSEFFPPFGGKVRLIESILLPHLVAYCKSFYSNLLET